MLTKETFQAIQISTTLAYYVGGGNFKWNSETSSMELGPKSTLTQIKRGLSILSSICFGLVAWGSVLLLYASPQKLISKPIVPMFSAAGSYSILVVLSLQTRRLNFVMMMNQLVGICKIQAAENTRVAAKFKEWPKSQQRVNKSSMLTKFSNLVLTFLIMLNLLIVVLFGLVYVAKCKIHLLNVLLPEPTCAHANLEPEFSLSYLAVWIRAGGLMLLQVGVLAHFQAFNILTLSFVIPFLFCTLEILQDLRKSNLREPEQYHHFQKMYKCIQVLVATFNDSNFASYMFYGHITIFYLSFIFLFKILLNPTSPDWLKLFSALYCYSMTGYYLIPLSIVWRVTKASEDLKTCNELKSYKRNKVEVLNLKSMSLVRVRGGYIGYFDQDMYLFIAVLIIDYTINYLLL